MPKTLTPSLTWPARPIRTRHALLGRLVRFQTQCGRYRVDRYADVPGMRFHALALVSADTWAGLGGSPYRTRQAAMRACEAAAKRSGAKR